MSESMMRQHMNDRFGKVFHYTENPPLRLAGGGAFFSRERKEATILRRPHRVAAQN